METHLISREIYKTRMKNYVIICITESLAEKGFASEAVSDGHEYCVLVFQHFREVDLRTRVYYQVPPRQRFPLRAQLAFETEVKVPCRSE